MIVRHLVVCLVALAPATPLTQVVPASHYVLYGAHPTDDGLTSEPVAAIYTQSAIAHLIEQSAARPSDGQLPAMGGRIFVAFRAFRGGPDAKLVHAEPFARAIPRGPLQLKGALAPIETWTGESFVPLLGFPPPWTDVQLIAAFPIEVWSAEIDFVLVRERYEGVTIYRQFRHARVPRELFSSWR